MSAIDIACIIGLVLLAAYSLLGALVLCRAARRNDLQLQYDAAQRKLQGLTSSNFSSRL